MVDRVTTLLEKAIQTDNDKEALAALRQARKFYRGTGTAVMPRRVVRPQTTEIANTSPTIPLRDHETALARETARADNLLKQNRALEVENDRLIKQSLSEGMTADEEILNAAAEQIKKANMRVVKTWAVVALVAVLIFVVI